MGELTDYLKERYLKSNTSETKDMMQKQKVKNAIMSVCDECIGDSSGILTFEVNPEDLVYATEVVLEEPLCSKYTIVQISDTLFSAKIQEVEL